MGDALHEILAQLGEISMTLNVAGIYYYRDLNMGDALHTWNSSTIGGISMTLNVAGIDLNTTALQLEINTHIYKHTQRYSKGIKGRQLH